MKIQARSDECAGVINSNIRSFESDRSQGIECSRVRNVGNRNTVYLPTTEQSRIKTADDIGTS